MPEQRGTVRHIEQEREQRNDLIRGPKWRVEASPEKRRRAVAVTLAIGLAIGLVVLWGVMWALGELGAPGWLVLAPWFAPTAVILIWTLVRPQPAVVADDDQAWVTYSVRYVMFGDDEPRPAPMRVIAALVVGAPIAWALCLFWLLAVVGLTDL